MINIKKLSDFLSNANKVGYSSGIKAKKIKEKDKSKTIIFKKGDWKFHDNYFGGEPYGGREVVFFKNKPVYMIVYYGFVNKSVSDFKKVYKFLQEALSQKSKNSLQRRGPKKYVSGDFVYTNNFNGKIESFYGEEIIKIKGKKVYSARYAGGLVDQRIEKNG
ncbi:MAG: DUF5680 domain-containing protein [Candidatus Paceibacterota bacterium]